MQKSIVPTHLQFCHKGVCTHNIQGGHTKDAAGIYTNLLVYLGCNRHSAVHLENKYLGKFFLIKF